ncbi:MAG: phage tail spike protein, partial [Clostridium sp.]
SKVKTLIWKDERYTDINALKEDTILKLNELSKPYRAYSCDIDDLARSNKEEYQILDFSLGDTITLISKTNNVKEKQRIVRIVEYPYDPERNSCEIANSILRFEDVQKEFQEATDTVNNITTDNGTINGSTIDGIETGQIKEFDAQVNRVVNLTAINAEIENLKADKADIGSLNAVEAKIGTLEATTAKITDLNATNANIENLQATTAKIVDLEATNAKIGVLEAGVAKIGVIEADMATIKNLVSGNISSDNIQTGGITGDNLNMSTIFVNDANIININASKINAGELDTSKVVIKSSDGSMRLVGATQQFLDKNNRIRIQLGKDQQGNFDFYILAENGNILFNTRGITGNAIENGLIKENMVADGAVGGKKINWSSFSTEFNSSTNTTKLNSSKILLDGTNQTLNVAFNEVNSKV